MRTVKTRILKLFALAILCALRQRAAAKQPACAAAVGNPSGNYVIPGVLGDVKYREELTLDAYAPAGTPRPAAILIHGSRGDKSTHLTQLFEILERAGFAWFSLNYRNLDDLRAALAYVRCPGRFNITGRLVLIAEDAGAPLAARIAQEIKAGGLVIFGAQVTGNIPALDIPVLMIQGTQDEESPADKVEAVCRRWKSCEFFPVAEGIHNFENWHPDQWDWKEKLTMWLRGDSRGLWNNITYSRPDGRDLLMNAFVPSGDGPFPAVIIAHGGGWEAGDKVTYVSPIFAPLARAGFAWFSIDYRLAPYVHNSQQLDDLRAAIRYVRSHAEVFHVKQNRIATLGESASGQMVTQVASEPCPGCEVQAVVSFYGVYDFTGWANRDDTRPTLDRVFGNWDAETLLRYSPLHHVRKDLPPILLIQGTNDELYRGTLAYAEHLKQQDARYDLILLDGAPHGMENWVGHVEWEFYKTRLIDWLKSNLAEDRK